MLRPLLVFDLILVKTSVLLYMMDYFYEGILAYIFLGLCTYSKSHN
jgi:hypothetical protein